MAEMPKYYKIHIDGCTVELEPIYTEMTPVIFGKWELKEIQIAPFGVTQALVCSNCGYDHEYDEFFDRCPRCGAFMIGRGENETGEM